MSRGSARSLITPARLRQDLSELGVRPGATLVVHSSLSSVGWVIGGAEAVVRALIETVGESGTLAMPAAIPLCGDPAGWPVAVREEWVETIRQELPVFDRHTTPTTMGLIPETLRNWPGTRRSDHPLESVCARGRHAKEITRHHPLAFSEGKGSPFARLHDLGGEILLVGVGFERCTALHFAESLVEGRRVQTVRCPLIAHGRRVWREFDNVADDNGTHFPRVGEYLVERGSVRRGRVGDASSLLFAMTDLVEVALEYFERELRRDRR